MTAQPTGTAHGRQRPDLLRARRPGMTAAGPDQVSFRVIYEKAIDEAQGPR